MENKKVFKSKHITMLIFLAAAVSLFIFGNNSIQYFIGGILTFCGVLSAIE